MRAKAAALVVALIFLIESVPLSSSTEAAGPSVPAALALAVVPSTLPADNNTYSALVVSLVDKSGAPTVAQNDTVVYLTSSLQSVGKVQPTVTIVLGRNYALANFTTTKTAGMTHITATTNGLQSVLTDVTTLVARGYPTHLSVSAIPDTVVAKRNNIGSLIVELQDDAGLPAKAVADTTINLYSSNKNVLNVTESTAVIKAGQFIRPVNYTTGFVPGSALVTASSSGYGPGSTAVTVLGLPPLALKLLPQPTNTVTCGSPLVQSCSGRLVIALTDSQGNPVPAPRDITVFIRSSALSVITLPRDQVKIAAGDIATIASYTTTSSPGFAKITVSSPSLQSDFAKITSTNPIDSATRQPAPPSLLSLYVGPTVVLANHESYSSVVAALQGVNSTKVTVPTVNSTGPTKIVLTSSLSAVGNITQVFLTIPAGQNFAATVFTSTFQVGATTLTASGHNLLPDQNKLSTYGAVPAKIVLKTISSTFPADGAAHSALEVGLQDSFGAPALAPSYLAVNLTSSENGIAKVFPTSIKAGQSFTITNVTTGVIPGSANVTAVAKLSSGYIVSSAILNTVIPAPSAIGAYLSPPKAIFDNLHSPSLVVQLQDAASNPARARQAMTITITSSNTSVFGKTLSVTVDPGLDIVKVPVEAKTTGVTTLTLTSSGLTSATVTLTLLPQPFQAQITPLGGSIFANQTATITASAQLFGHGVKGVRVHWRASSGTLTGNGNSTDAQGTSSAVFTPSVTGAATIVATMTHPSFGTWNLTSTFVVVPTPAKVRPSLFQQLLTFPYVLVLAGAVAGALIGVTFVLRRRRKGGGETGEDAGFDLAVSAFPLPR